jgi:hypothetical protein
MNEYFEAMRSTARVLRGSGNIGQLNWVGQNRLALCGSTRTIYRDTENIVAIWFSASKRYKLATLCV